MSLLMYRLTAGSRSCSVTVKNARTKSHDDILDGKLIRVCKIKGKTQILRSGLIKKALLVYLVCVRACACVRELRTCVSSVFVCVMCMCPCDLCASVCVG